MATPVTLPQLGETVVEGTIVKWLKAEGDVVERDEPLFEISTDKVDTEVPSPVGGKLEKILVPEGETVNVGTEVAHIAEEGGGASSGSEEKPAEPPAAKAETPAPETPQAAPTPPPTATTTAPTGNGGGPQAPATQRHAVQAPSGRGPRSHILSPLVRRLAEEHGIDLQQVQGTGTGGRITKKDIQAFVQAGPVAAPAIAPAAAPAMQAVPPVMSPGGGREEVRPISHIRKRIAENMVASLHSAARAWNLVEVNMEHIVKLRGRAKDAFKAREGFSLTYMPFLARALCDALHAYPDVNARLNLAEGTATYHGNVNLGIAVAYDEGLIVPIIRGADEMNVVGIARAVNDIAQRARSKKLKPDEVHGGTFTITNPGPFGSLISVPIMNPGETAILAFDAIEKRPVVVDDAIGIRHMVYLSMSWDHRMIDGATAAQFIGRLKQNLETWDFTPEVQAYLG
ncbi:MAG TPA: 2-oxoglutarate dehydrogenase, E2 component, dihydrolipoamide succinyltransferase [Actinomycetota bacterium]